MSDGLDLGNNGSNARFSLPLMLDRGHVAPPVIPLVWRRQATYPALAVSTSASAGRGLAASGAHLHVRLWCVARGARRGTRCRAAASRPASGPRRVHGVRVHAGRAPHHTDLQVRHCRAVLLKFLTTTRARRGGAREGPRRARVGAPSAARSAPRPPGNAFLRPSVRLNSRSYSSLAARPKWGGPSKC